MRALRHNPAENVLPPGVKEAHLTGAISASGYPVQGVVAHHLLSSFQVVEEWDFVDDTTDEHRNLDVFAFRKYDTGPDVGDVTLSLLIECKRSRHPFVFFKRVTSTPIPLFPAIGGVAGGFVPIRERARDTARGSSSRSTHVNPALALGMTSLPFIVGGPPECATMSRATVSGKKVSLSGDESFRDLVLPLVKSLRHALATFEGYRSGAHPFGALCIAVLDAPMLLVEDPQKADDPILCPWVRVIRREPHPDHRSWGPSRFYAIDVVHSGFFQTFIADHVMPFGDALAERVRARGWVLTAGGTVHNLDDWSWEQVSRH